jgi:hypothetical protein
VTKRPYVHDPDECGCENHAPWCPLNPDATEVKPWPSVLRAVAKDGRGKVRPKKSVARRAGKHRQTQRVTAETREQEQP